MLLSQFSPATPSPPCPQVCSWCLRLSLLPCKQVHCYHFSKFHTYVLIYDICFSLSDLLYPIWQSLGPLTSLQMTQFCSFLWLSNISLYVCITSSLSILCWWTFRLLPHSGYSKQCCNEHWGSCVFLNYAFLWVSAQEWDCWVIW